MWHLLMAHQQESFLPFSSRQSLSSCLSHMAKGSTPKLHGPNSRPIHAVLLGMAAVAGFKSPCQSSSAAPFPTPPTISYICQYSCILPALLGCHSPGRHGPMAWSQSSPSSHPGAVTRGSCFPVTSWVEVTPIPLAQSMATAI